MRLSKNMLINFDLHHNFETFFAVWDEQKIVKKLFDQKC